MYLSVREVCVSLFACVEKCEIYFFVLILIRHFVSVCKAMLTTNERRVSS